MRRLLIRPGAIGDFIVSLPALEFLRAEETEVWTSGANVSLARFADRAVSIADTGIDTLGLPDRSVHEAVLEKLRSFDSIVSWYGTNREEFRAATAGLPMVFHPALPVEGGKRHAVDFYLEQVGAPLGAVPQLPVTRRRGEAAVIHPFSGSARKNWPLENFRRLADELSRQMPVCWTAGPEEALAEAVRFDDLWDLAEWLAGARLYIGNDSGISHLAAACGVPVVALFGPTSPRIWAPRGPAVRVVRAPEGRMNALGVEEVLREVAKLLASA